MIHEQKIDVVVMLSNLEEGLTSCQGKKMDDDIETGRILVREILLYIF